MATAHSAAKPVATKADALVCALVYLDQIRARGEQVQDRRLREINLMMVDEARAALWGQAGWRQEQVDWLVWQIIEGVFEETVRKVV